MRVAGDGTRGSGLIRIHVVILAVCTERDAGDYGNSTRAPDRLNPPRIGRADFPYESQIGTIVGLFARTETRAVGAAKSDRRLSQSSNLGDQSFIYFSRQNHQ